MVVVIDDSLQVRVELCPFNGLLGLRRWFLFSLPPEHDGCACGGTTKVEDGDEMEVEM